MLYILPPEKSHTHTGWSAGIPSRRACGSDSRSELLAQPRIAGEDYLVLLRDRGVGILHWARLDPIVAGIVGGVALDFSFYVAHVAMHKVPAFWNVHRVHHSDPVVDVTTTIRQHPAEGLIRYAFMATFRVRIGSGARRRRVSPGGSSRRGARRAANVRALPRRMKRFATSP